MTREKIGYVHVDAGMVFVGDPCYTMPDDAHLRDQVADWSKFCDAIIEDLQEKGYASPLKNEYISEGLGLVVESGYGDGTYSVYIERDPHEGRPARLIVEFISEDDDEVY